MKKIFLLISLLAFIEIGLISAIPNEAEAEIDFTYPGISSCSCSSGNSSFNQSLTDILYARYQFENNNFNGSGSMTASSFNSTGGSSVFFGNLTVVSSLTNATNKIPQGFNNAFAVYQNNTVDYSTFSGITLGNGARLSNVGLDIKNPTQWWRMYLYGADGGMFTIYDVTHGKLPFKIRNNNPTNTFVMENGKIAMNDLAFGITQASFIINNSIVQLELKNGTGHVNFSVDTKGDLRLQSTNSSAILNLTNMGLYSEGMTLSSGGMVIGNNVTIGEGDSGVDYQQRWNGESHDGDEFWMEDENFWRRKVTSGLTTGFNSVTDFMAYSVGGMNDYFASGISFTVGDSGATSTLGNISFYRFGADNQGFMSISLNDLGTIRKILTLQGGSGLVLGSGKAGADYSFTVDGETNDGTFYWREDENYWEFADNVTVSGNISASSYVDAKVGFSCGGTLPVADGIYAIGEIESIEVKGGIIVDINPTAK